MQEAIRTKDGLCLACGGHHDPDPEDTYVDFKGYRFKPPFYCMCCGKEICGRQFAFGRCCGVCDMGACDINNRVYKPEYAHAHPNWWRPIGHVKEYIDGFAKFAKAEPSPI